MGGLTLVMVNPAQRAREVACLREQFSSQAP